MRGSQNNGKSNFVCIYSSGTLHPATGRSSREPMLAWSVHRLSYVIPEKLSKILSGISPPKSTKILLEMSKILQKLSKFPKILKISVFFL